MKNEKTAIIYTFPTKRNTTPKAANDIVLIDYIGGIPYLEIRKSDGSQEYIIINPSYLVDNICNSMLKKNNNPPRQIDYELTDKQMRKNKKNVQRMADYLDEIYGDGINYVKTECTLALMTDSTIKIPDKFIEAVYNYLALFTASHGILFNHGFIRVSKK